MDIERAKMRRQESNDTGLVVLGIILGLGVGVGIALIYSRGTGKQNRKALNQWAHRRLDGVQRKVEGVVKRDG